MAMPMLHEIDPNDIELFEELGGGSFGTVYRAKWKSRDMVVAAKKAKRASVVIEKEASVLSTLSHQNIIQFYGAVLKEPNCLLVTEYAENGSLYDFLQQPGNSLDFDCIIHWAKDIARGINYLHNLPDKIIHRDLKSQNVVITRDWDCKICDFGSSRFFKGTTIMSFVGTYPWMAPEVIQSMPVSKSCDTWSYGVCLWELLTNEVPFKGMEGAQVIFAVGNGKRLTIPSSCPPCFGQLMKACWKLEPKERPTFKEILSMLDNMCKDESLPSITNSFVGNKSAWRRAEIEETLKKADHDLAAKEKDRIETDHYLEEARAKSMVMVYKGYEYTLLVRPPVESRLVLAQEENLASYINISIGLENMELAAVCLRLAILEVQQNHGLHRPTIIQDMQHEFAMLSNLCDSMIGEFRIKAGDVLDDLECGLSHLFKGHLELAEQNFSSLCKTIKKMLQKTITLETEVKAKEACIKAILEEVTQDYVKEPGQMYDESATSLLQGRIERGKRESSESREKCRQLDGDIEKKMMTKVMKEMVSKNADGMVDMSLRRLKGGVDQPTSLTPFLALSATLVQECESIANSGMTGRFLEACEQTGEETKLFWEGAAFKLQALKYYARWVALQKICGYFHVGMETFQKGIHLSIGENPSPEEAKTRLADLYQDIDKKRAQQRQESEAIKESG